MRDPGEKLRKCPTCGADPPVGFRNYANWAFDILPKKVGFTDLDAVLEHHGKFLVMEFKPEPGSTWVPRGQWLLFHALVTNPDWEVWVVAPELGDENKVVVRYIRKGIQTHMTVNALKKHVEDWWEAA